jgi:signal transduction histidine kinase
MKNLWHTISHFGLNEDTKISLRNRTIVLTNQINFVMLVLLIFLNIAITFIREIEGGTMSVGSIRLMLLLFVNILIFIFTYNRLIVIAKITLSTLPTFILFIVPTLVGFVEEESFFYYQVGIIALSILPHLILLPTKKNYAYWSIIIFHLLVILFQDDILIFFAPEKFQLIDIINKFRFFYKTVPVGVFIFTHLALIYLRNLNINFENEITRYNQQLLTFNEELVAKNETISEQKDELEVTLLNLKDTQSKLIQADKMASLGILTSGVSHEINNPLNFINAGVTGIEDFIEEYQIQNKDEFLPLINGIKVGVDRIAAIVKGLNQFAITNDSKMEVCDIHEIMNNCLVMIQNQTNNRIAIKKNYTTKTYKLKGNVGKLHQLILNLLSNSVDAINEKGEIIIETSISKNYFNVKIEDNGSGIPDELLTMITDPFFTTKEPGKGTGLGLSISYNIVQEHNGSIEFTSKEGNGTVVIIKLPIEN